MPLPPPLPLPNVQHTKWRPISASIDCVGCEATAAAALPEYLPIKFKTVSHSDAQAYVHKAATDSVARVRCFAAS